ncbi:MAG TPA: hypothetical protein VMR70_00790 [Flavisolibacter sp.]|nr:hypothetical protein [Flavisolibacter sp.]
MKFLYLFFLFLVGCVNATNTRSESNQSFCSPNSTIDKLEKYDFEDADTIHQSDIIKLEGVVTFQFENVAIYPKATSEPKDAFWIHFSPHLVEYINEIEKMDGKKVLVAGKLDFNQKGHLGSYKGTLDSIFCITTIQ